MHNQLDIFEEENKKSYKAMYDDFYSGVRERYQKEAKERTAKQNTPISININTIKTQGK